MRYVVALCFMAGCVSANPCMEYAGVEDYMRVHVIDVGQGAATLIEFPTAAILIDTGGERFPDEEWKEPQYDSTEELRKYLDAFFLTRPDLKQRLALLVLTHPHPDHTRGVKHVLDAYSPEHIIHNGQRVGPSDGGQEVARKYVRMGGAKGYYVLEENIKPSTGLTNPIIDPVNPPQGSGLTDPIIRALWGQVKNSDDWDWEEFSDPNNHSLVLRIDFGKASILFTGDLEESEHKGKKAGIERLIEKYLGTDLLDVDVYHVGHHGSHNGTTTALAKAMTPKIAVISSGPAKKRAGFSAWTHAHPRTETLKELESVLSFERQPAITASSFDHWKAEPVTRTMNKALFSTGWDGSVVLEAHKDGTWMLKKPNGQLKP